MQNNNHNEIILITGPIKSGKSVWAEKIASHSDKVIYIATSLEIHKDKQWAERIIKHKERRPSTWGLIESTDIKSVINGLDSISTLLIDSIGGLVTNNLHLSTNEWRNMCNNIISSLVDYKGRIIIVAEETGWGVSPNTSIGNLFRERLGQLTEEIDIISSDSWIVVHGRAINIAKNSIRI